MVTSAGLVAYSDKNLRNERFNQRSYFIDGEPVKTMDVDSLVRRRARPELPSKAMQEKFELWENDYTLDALTDLSRSQIESKRLLFKNEEERLLAKHRPGRVVANRPALSHIRGKPPYNAVEWKRAREMIRNEAQKVYLRFERAKGIVSAEEKKATRKWITKIIESINVNFNLK